jgi:hypothetical protein
VGEHLAGLYSLIATCEANEVNPVDLSRRRPHSRAEPSRLADRRVAAAQLEPAETRAVGLSRSAANTKR